MPKMVGVKEASADTGLSEWELKRGVREGIYPYIRIGEGKGKFYFDLDLLHETLRRQALANINVNENVDKVVTFGIRKVN